MVRITPAEGEEEGVVSRIRSDAEKMVPRLLGLVVKAEGSASYAFDEPSKGDVIKIAQACLGPKAKIGDHAVLSVMLEGSEKRCVIAHLSYSLPTIKLDIGFAGDVVFFASGDCDIHISGQVIFHGDEEQEEMDDEEGDEMEDEIMGDDMGHMTAMAFGSFAGGDDFDEDDDDDDDDEEEEEERPPVFGSKKRTSTDDDEKKTEKLKAVPQKKQKGFDGTAKGISSSKKEEKKEKKKQGV